MAFHLHFRLSHKCFSHINELVKLGRRPYWEFEKKNLFLKTRLCYNMIFNKVRPISALILLTKERENKTVGEVIDRR